MSPGVPPIPRKSDRPDPRPQADKFRDMARELECDEDEAAFNERLRKIAKAPKLPNPKEASRTD